MITSELVNINGVELLHTYSTLGYEIECDGVVYGEAYDKADTDRVYTEVVADREATAEDYQKALAQLGVEV